LHRSVVAGLPTNFSEEPQYVAAAHFGKQPRLGRQIGHPPMDRKRLAVAIQPVDLRHACRWPQIAQQQSQQGSLARAVWTQQAEHCAAGHFQVAGIQCHEPAVALRQ